MFSAVNKLRKEIRDNYYFSPTWRLPFALPFIIFLILCENYHYRRARTFPKVTRRKRALSLRGRNDNASPPLRGRTVGQTRSLFFKLPAELRVAIYKEVITKGKIHIILTKTHKRKYEIYSYRCPVPQTLQNCSLRHPFSCEPSCNSETNLNRPGLGVLGLLQSCRGMYVSSAMLYN